MSTIVKAVDLLFLLGTQPGACGVTTVAQALGLPKTSAHRLLRSLTHRRVVQRDPAGRYRLGTGLAALAVAALGHDPLSGIAHPVMQAHAQELGETFFLVSAQAGDLVVADKVDGRGFLRASPPVGSSVPVHATAVGKVVLAYAPDLVHAPVGRLRAYTSRTATTPAALRRSITTTQRAGYAISRDEWVQGLTAVAAPIRAGERLVGAIAAALVSQRLGELGLDPVVQSVLSAAAAINLKLAGG
jgi:DNA-binding IclR family transcriptional regulator